MDRPTPGSSKQLEDDMRLVVHAIAGLVAALGPALWAVVPDEAIFEKKEEMIIANNINNNSSSAHTSNAKPSTSSSSQPHQDLLVAAGTGGAETLERELKRGRDAVYHDFEKHLKAVAETQKTRACVAGLVMNKWGWNPTMEEKTCEALKRNVEILGREHERMISDPDEVWSAATGGRAAEIAKNVSGLLCFPFAGVPWC
jgi:hypothetical protein